VAEDELEGEGGDQLIRGQDIVSFSQWAEKQADQAGAPAKETEKKPSDSPQVTAHVFNSVSVPDPDLILIQSGQWIEIQEGKNDPQK
jgi:hypothetical protein